MMNVFVLAQSAQRIKTLSHSCGVQGVDMLIHSADLTQFDPSTEPELQTCRVVLLDHGEGIEQRTDVIERLLEVNEDLKILVTGIPRLPDAERNELIFGYLDYGATGYVGADVEDQLADAMLEVSRGGAWIEPGLTAELVQRTVALRESLAAIKPHSFGFGQPEVLTPRQNQVLELLAAGMSNREIADELFISIGTVKNHVHRILEVLQASSREKAAEYYHFLQSPAAAA